MEDSPNNRRARLVIQGETTPRWGDRRRGLRTANAADIFMLKYGQGRPTKAGEEYNVYFMGVDPGSTRQRFAFGLSSFNIGREGTGVP